MGVLNDFLGKPAQGKDALEPIAHSFPELDLEKIKQDLHLAEEGKKRGEKNLPPSSSEALDDIEHKIITTIETEQRRYLQSANSQLASAQQQISSLDLEHEAVSIGGAAQRASSDFMVKVDDGKAKLFMLWRNVCMIEEQWNAFRAQHKLSHPADYPLSRLWNFAVILAILVVESILNGNFLARGLETGLVGGIIEAFVIAAVNVSFGVFLGNFVVRYMFHCSLPLRILAFIEVPVSFCIAIG
ncbi:MAG TPA: hypothetical protein VFR09_04925, partial [Alphaproteobacteria bacterium]|nr:hypothetical protein [Alphaproteobacteria bacterium]